MDDLYRELIIDRYKKPPYIVENWIPTISLLKMTIRYVATISGSNCVDGDRAKEAVFEGHGCAISQAAADLLLEAIVGKTLEEVKAMTRDDLLGILGMDLGPVRVKCALLSLKVLKAGVYGLGEASDELVV